MVRFFALWTLPLLFCLSAVECEAFQAASPFNLAAARTVAPGFPDSFQHSKTTSKSSSTVLWSSNNNDRFDPFATANTAIFAFGLGFLALSFILPNFGYDFVTRDGRLSIGTVEEAQEQRDAVKQRKMLEKEALSTSFSLISSSNLELLQQ